MSASSQSPVTLRQIATRLGISHTTVSRSLKDDPRISEAVRKRVKREADRMGYRPDPMLAALAHYRRRQSPHQVNAALAWVNCWPDPRKLRTYKEFDLYWQGASAEASRSGYHLDEFNCPQELSPARLHEILRARGIQGILLSPGSSGVTPDWGSFPWNDFAIVRFGHSLQFPTTHLVTSDQLANGLLAFQQAQAKGYQRIGMVTRRIMAAKIVRSSAGYLHAQMQVTEKSRLSPLLLGEPDLEADQHALVRWIKQAQPQVILTDIAELRRMLTNAGYRIPKDIGLAAMSVLDGDADAGIDQNSEEIGASAIQLLISLLHHNQRGIPAIPRELLIPGRWVDGKTLPRKQ